MSSTRLGPRSLAPSPLLLHLVWAGINGLHDICWTRVAETQRWTTGLRQDQSWRLVDNQGVRYCSTLRVYLIGSSGEEQFGCCNQ